MPATGVRQEFELKTRGSLYNTLQCEIGIKINGKELPNVASIGAALDAAVEAATRKILESFNTVPGRL